MSSMTATAAVARSAHSPKQGQRVSCADGTIVSHFGTNDAAQAARCGLMDLTPLARTGFRGARAEAHLNACTLPVAEAPNQAAVAESGELVLRLSQREFWVLGSLRDMGQKVAELVAKPAADGGCYPLFCQDSHGWFALTGEAGARVMAKLCALDMRDAAFPDLSIAQTSVARINTVVVRHRIKGTPVFSLLFDVSYESYLWEVLLDAMQEFEGTPVGCAVFV